MNQNRKQAPVSWKRGLVSLLVAMLVLNLCMPGIVTRAEELPAQEATAQIPEEGTVLPEGGAADENLQPLTEEDSQEEITKEDTKEDTTTEEDTSEDITEEAITTGEDSAVEDTEVVSEIHSVNTIVTDAAVSGQQMETEVELSALEQMNAYYDQAVAAGDDAETSVYAEIYNGAMAVYTAAGSPSEADDPELYKAMGMVVTTLNGYGYNPYAVQDLASWPGDGNQGGGGNELNPTKYNSSSYVFYDTMTPTYNTDGSVKSGSVNTADRAKISSVVLNTETIPQRDSSSSSWSTTGAPQLNTIFPNASKSSSSSDTSTMQSGTLVITPAPGYYVAAVVVACTSRTSTGNSTVSGSNPYACNTWAEGNAFTDTFEIGIGGAATVNLSSLDFSHGSEADAYFVLISVLPVPEPLFVEYDYGIIGEKLGDALSTSAFNHVDNWTDNNEENAYGTGGVVLTNDTQFKYAYSVASEAANWKHYANTITTDALTDAAEVGYYFTGWRVEYYTDCTAEEATDAAENENNYTLTFPADKSYGTATATPGGQVSLSTHCRIIAQWAPIELRVNKVVSGLDSYNGSYTVQLQKDGVNYKDPHTFTVAGSGTSDTWTISPITPGTYTIVETSPAAGSYVTDGDTTKYLVSTTYSADVNITVDGIINNTCRINTLTVTNTYSDATPKLKIVKNWQDSNGNALTGEATASMPAVIFTVSCETHNFSETVTVTYTDGWAKVPELDLPDGCSVGELSVTETVPTGYKLVTTNVTTEEDTTNKIIYTVHTATNKQDNTTITLDKNVAGNMGSYNDEFTFNVTINDEPYSGNPIKLTHLSDPVTITVPIGAEVVITEVASGNYVASATVDGEKVNLTGETDKTLTIEAVAAAGHAVVFTNTNEAVIETGLRVDSFPMYLLMSTMIVFGGLLLISKRRYGDWM